MRPIAKWPSSIRRLASKAFPNQSAVGKRILTRIITPEPEWVEVIGVVGHQHEESLATPGREQIYFADGFFGHGAAAYWAIRTVGDPAKYSEAVRAAIARDGSAKRHVGSATDGRVGGQGAGGHAFLAAADRSVRGDRGAAGRGGLYGVLATVVRQRTAEIGVRMALGAAPSSVFRLMIGQGLRLSAAGIGLGLIAAFGLTRVMISMLVGVKPTDPVTYVAMVGMFFAITAFASWIPARRAAALDPTRALREE